MVQFSQIAIALTMAISGFGLVSAKSCHKGGIYCGQDLLNRGDYISKIKINLEAHDFDTDKTTINNSLWDCTEHGDISLREVCHNKCQGGDSKDDYCVD
ncbi:hypothetical protein F4677DRAFT_462687 [Hypoxylon crocopeplum]|nr:hypothetical protein F4677DRAFT_462687 [Hypoxylon crocopeplum]